MVENLLSVPDNISDYAKKKCSVCSGKGYFQFVGEGNYTLCHCVKKKLIKEAKETLQ